MVMYMNCRYGGVKYISKRIIYAVVTAAFVVFQFCKHDLAILAGATSFGWEITLGLFDYFSYIVYAVLIIFSLMLLIRDVRLIKWRAAVPILICVIVVTFFFIIPSSNLYLKWNYCINKESRIKTIAMVENGSISSRQIDVHVYMVPYRLTSRTRTMIIQNRNDVQKVLFYTYKGVTVTKIIVYVSDDSGIMENDFNFHSPEYNHLFSNINKLAPNWYSATLYE